MNQQPGLSFAPGAAGSAPTPAPIHDIVGPFAFFTGPLWVLVIVFLAVVFIGGLLWWFFGRRKIKPLTPRESALEALSRLRSQVSEGSDHDFGVGVSDVLRRFLGEAFGLAAPRQTTEEFLSSLHGSLRFMEQEQKALSDFLHQSDYLKYARGEATSDQRLALIEAAESFVLSGDKQQSDQPESAEKTESSPEKEVA